MTGNYEVPGEAEYSQQSAGAMNTFESNDEQLDALMARVAADAVDPGNELEMMLREVRFQLRAAPPIQIGAELGEFIGVEPASATRYAPVGASAAPQVPANNTVPESTAEVRYLPVLFQAPDEEIFLEPTSPLGRTQQARGGFVLAAAAIIVAAMIVGAGFSRALTGTGGGNPVEVIVPANQANQVDDAVDADGIDQVDVDQANIADDPVIDDTAIDDGGPQDMQPELVDFDQSQPMLVVEPTATAITEPQPESPAARKTTGGQRNQSNRNALNEATPVPTETPTAVANNVAVEQPTRVPTVAPTSTPVPPTPVPPTPIPTATPVPPTATPVPPTPTSIPTATPVPPTPTPIPPTATPVPTSTPAPTATALPTSTPSPTPTPNLCDDSRCAPESRGND